VEKTNAVLPQQIRVMTMKRVTRGFSSKDACNARTYEYLMPTYAFAPFRLSTLDYRIDDETLIRVNGLLQQYVGTHNFHNFTSRRPFEDASSKRYVMSFECGKPFLSSARCPTCHEGREVQFVPLHVKGQSFMLHQIRKMIGRCDLIPLPYLRTHTCSCCLSFPVLNVVDQGVLSVAMPTVAIPTPQVW